MPCFKKPHLVNMIGSEFWDRCTGNKNPYRRLGKLKIIRFFLLQWRNIGRLAQLEVSEEYSAFTPDNA